MNIFLKTISCIHISTVLKTLPLGIFCLFPASFWSFTLCYLRTALFFFINLGNPSTLPHNSVLLQRCLYLLRFSAAISTWTDQKGEGRIREAHPKGLKRVWSQFFSWSGDYIGRLISVYLRREATGGTALWKVYYWGLVKNSSLFFSL